MLSYMGNKTQPTVPSLDSHTSELAPVVLYGGGCGCPDTNFTQNLFIQMDYSKPASLDGNLSQVMIAVSKLPKASNHDAHLRGVTVAARVGHG